MKTNTKISRKAKIQNNLRQARHRAGLERKQVSFLLLKKTTDELSHYENGDYPPNLQTALKLEIIYKMPIRLLFQSLFEVLETEIAELKTKHSSLFPSIDWFPKPSDQLTQEEHCFYAELMKNHIPNELEIRTILKHILALNNTVSDYKQGRTPFVNKETDERNNL